MMPKKSCSPQAQSEFLNTAQVTESEMQMAKSNAWRSSRVRMHRYRLQRGS